MNILDLADLSLDLAIVAAVPAYIVLQVWVLTELPGGWRHAGLLPPVVALSILASSFDAVSAGTALPIRAIAFFAPAAALYLAAMIGLAALAQRFAWRSPAAAEPSIA